MGMMATDRKDQPRTPSPKTLLPPIWESSWAGRIRKTVLKPLGKAPLSASPRRDEGKDAYINSKEHSRIQVTPDLPHSASSKSSPSRYLLNRMVHASRNLITPTRESRPSSTPTSNIVFSPVRWELNEGDTKSSTPLASIDEYECPYNPSRLHSFPRPDRNPSGSWWKKPSKERLPTPCNECLGGGERAHINVSPSKFLRRSIRPARSSSQETVEASTNDESLERSQASFNYSHPDLYPHSHRQKATSLSGVPISFTERHQHEQPRRYSEGRAIYERLKEVVEHTTFSKGESQGPLELHHLSPDISYIHRKEVASHQAALLEGRSTPLLARQTHTASGIHGTRSTTDFPSTVLYSRSSNPGEYIPPVFRTEMDSLPIVSPLRRRAISLAPLHRPLLISRLDQPPFVPALPARTFLLPVGQWGIPRLTQSAPPDYAQFLRHATRYRSRGPDYSPRVPSPLRIYSAASVDEDADINSIWSHGKQPFFPDPQSELTSPSTGDYFNRPKLRGGADGDTATADLLANLRDHSDMMRLRRSCRLAEVLTVMKAFNPKPRPCPPAPPPSPHRSYEALVTVAIPALYPTPHLRGGAGSPTPTPDPKPRYVPSSLFYLAGGRNKLGYSISENAWNKQKPQKRMGGLLGLAVYGAKAVRSNRLERDVGVQTDVEPVREAEVMVGVEVREV